MRKKLRRLHLTIPTILLFVSAIVTMVLGEPIPSVIALSCGILFMVLDYTKKEEDEAGKETDDDPSADTDKNTDYTESIESTGDKDVEAGEGQKD